MSAKILHDGTIEIRTCAGVHIFDRTFASLAWPEESSGHMIVCGITPDGRLAVFTECAGGLLELGDMAVRAKNDYAMDAVIVDDRDRVSTVGLRNLEGLCFDDSSDGNSEKRLKSWRAFRKSSFADLQDAVAVCPAPREIMANYRGALERARLLIMKRRIIIDDIECPALAHELFQPMNYVMGSAAVRALVLASGSVRTGEPAWGSQTRTLWYANMRRAPAHAR